MGDTEDILRDISSRQLYLLLVLRLRRLAGRRAGRLAKAAAIARNVLLTDSALGKTAATSGSRTTIRVSGPIRSAKRLGLALP